MTVTICGLHFYTTKISRARAKKNKHIVPFPVTFRRRHWRQSQKKKHHYKNKIKMQETSSQVESVQCNPWRESSVARVFYPATCERTVTSCTSRFFTAARRHVVRSGTRLIQNIALCERGDKQKWVCSTVCVSFCVWWTPLTWNLGYLCLNWAKKVLILDIPWQSIKFWIPGTQYGIMCEFVCCIIIICLDFFVLDCLACIRRRIVLAHGQYWPVDIAV